MIPHLLIGRVPDSCEKIFGQCVLPRERRGQDSSRLGEEESGFTFVGGTFHLVT
ncbi:hypothetical protein CEXT_584251, partial [Caerostris extrusa]